MRAGRRKVGNSPGVWGGLRQGGGPGLGPGGAASSVGGRVVALTASLSPASAEPRASGTAGGAWGLAPHGALWGNPQIGGLCRPPQPAPSHIRPGKSPPTSSRELTPSSTATRCLTRACEVGTLRRPMSSAQRPGCVGGGWGSPGAQPDSQRVGGGGSWDPRRPRGRDGAGGRALWPWKRVWGGARPGCAGGPGTTAPSPSVSSQHPGSVAEPLCLAGVTSSHSTPACQQGLPHVPTASLP